MDNKIKKLTIFFVVFTFIIFIYNIVVKKTTIQEAIFTSIIAGLLTVLIMVIIDKLKLKKISVFRNKKNNIY